MCGVDKCRYYVYNESMTNNNTTKGNAMRNLLWIIKELALMFVWGSMIMITSVIGALILLSDMM